VSAERIEDHFLEQGFLFQCIDEMISFGTWTADANGRLTHVSDSFLSRLGMTLEEYHQNGRMRLHPEDRERVLEAWRSGQENGSPWRCECRLQDRDGRYFGVLASAVAFRDAAGKIAGWVGINLDITERLRTEAHLRRKERQLEEAQRVAGVGSWEWDIIANHTIWTDEFYRIYGLRPQELDPRAAFEKYCHPQDRELLRATVLQAVRDRGGCVFEHRLVRPDGTVRFVHLRGEVVLDSSGTPVRMIGTLQDITERKRLEEQLLHSQKLEAVGRLAGGIAHDFNNLLTVITGYSHLLATELPSDGNARSHAWAIHQAADRAASLTSQLLAFGRRQFLRPKVLDLNGLLHDMEDMLRRLLGENMELILTLDPQLRPVKADPGQIQQVVLNLAVNARDAMPNGGRLMLETGNCRLDEAYAQKHLEVRPGDYVMLAVRDNGVGMTAEVRAHLFEPFYTTKEVGKGTGLGLSTSYGILKQSGGHLDVESTPGEGATFRAYLPCLPEAVAPEAPESPKPPLARPAECVLLVEDEDMVRAFGRTVLQRYGYTVLEAKHGEEALHPLRELQAAHPRHDHIRNQEMNRAGMMLAARLRPEAKVLYLSGYVEDAMTRLGISGAADTFLCKPFTADGLARKVREVLDGHPASGTKANALGI
jgi:PAS domain S-box-containing protein